jgi:XTP/dITP diphosphohydrolase
LKKIAIATGNQHKFKEIDTYLKDTGYSFLSLKDFPDITEIEETGDTFEENAIIKAKALFKHTGLTSLADDSGLIVDILGSEPGVRSARYAGENATDEMNNDLLISKIKDLPEEKRTARFMCVQALINENETKLFTGECPGKVILELRGTNGFGYDPMFVPDGFDKTFGELTMDEKLKISHRAKALVKLKNYLQKK